MNSNESSISWDENVFPKPIRIVKLFKQNFHRKQIAPLFNFQPYDMPTLTVDRKNRGVKSHTRGNRGQRKQPRSAFRELLQLHSRIIRRSTDVYPQFRIENFPVNNISCRTIRKIFDKILRFTPFSMVAQAGIVLRNKFSNELRFFYPGYQTMIFEKPLRIFSGRNVDSVLRNYNPSEIIENFSSAYPDSAWIFVSVTNVRVFLTIAEFL